MNNEKEIPFGAFDSELMHQEIFIPEGFTATIDGNKIILTRKENEDERVRKALITYFQRYPYGSIGNDGTNPKEAIAWLEKQGNKESKKMPIWKHWKDGICGNGEGKLIYLIKNGDDYSLSSILGFECDYIELSELDNLMLKKGEQKSAECSKEDESNIKALESILYYDKKLPKDLYLRLNDWLKSLRPQNRWKVVDKGIYVKEPALAQKKDKSEPGQGFVVCYDHTLTPDVYERYIMLSDINCHSGWKPSDKQMEALLSEVNGWVKGCPKQIVLESLYDDLKKLKG